MSLALLMNTTVTYKVKGARDSNGDPTLGAAVTIPAHVEKTRKVVPTSDGQELVITDIVTSDTEIPENVVMWVLPATPDDDEGREPAYVSDYVDPTGSIGHLYEAGL
jgi:hypothetical protein